MRLGEALAYAVVAVSLAATVPAAAAETPEAPVLAPQPPKEPLPPIEEARPPLPPAPEPQPVPWEHHLEIGAGLAIAEAPVSVDGDNKPTPLRFRPAAGFHVDLSWQVHRFFRFSGYVVERDHSITWGPGALGLEGAIDGPKAHMYTFGVRFSPTLPLGSRGRLWITAGAGWGRIEYGRFTVMPPNSGALTLRERAESLFEVPLGIGGSFEIIPRWLSVHVELTGSFVPSQIGDALEHGQFIDEAGMKRDLAPMPKLDASFVQTIGLSLHL